MGVLFEGYREGHWWQYFVAVLLLILGLVFLYAGKVESVVFSKDDATVAKVKTTVVCTRQVTEWALDQVVNVRVFKRGQESIQVMTIHYEVQLDFRELPSVNILKTKDCAKAMRQMAEIKEFLGMPISRTDLRYIDESTSKLNPSQKYRT